MNPKLRGQVNLAIRVWNKLAREHGGAVTMKKTDTRISAVRRMSKVLPQMDWSDKDNWKRYFTAVYSLKQQFERKHRSDDFRVTLDWALSPHNVRLVIRTLSAQQRQEQRAQRENLNAVA